MMDIVRGAVSNRAAMEMLEDELRQLQLEGTLYLGYPVLPTEAGTEQADALLTTPELGVVLFDLVESPAWGDPAFWAGREAMQTKLYLSLKSRLLRHIALVRKRELAVPLHVVTYVPSEPPSPPDADVVVAARGNLKAVLGSLKKSPPELYRALNSAIQHVATIKPVKKRNNVKRADSRGQLLRQIEAGIANLDRWQNQAAIECPEGPQRIRGLAGSGKTVVLALKAAYLHARNPEWRIAVTFVTRSLYKQFTDLIRRFYFDQAGDEPNWNNLRIRHAWGSAKEPGIYAEIAQHYGVTPVPFGSASAKYGQGEAFQGVCEELERVVVASPSKALYDVILIDEAQDLPHPFFRIAYAMAEDPKRVVWAYDELQNLGAYSMSSPEELFGTHPGGGPRVTLQNEAGAPHQDVILPRCYRNTPWALVVAHALGFGVYRVPDGLVQFFDDPGLWSDIGYEVRSGSLTPGQSPVLARRRDSYPGFFEKLLKPEDAVRYQWFKDDQAQALWIAESIEANIRQDELDPDDILVIAAGTPISDRVGPLVAALRERGIAAHIAGVTSSVDEFAVPGSVTISGIYRAKGNEAPMVYVLDSEHCYEGRELITRRNTLFTGITRSRAWVRICGCGEAGERLRSEIEEVVKRDYCLEFTMPSAEDLAKMRRIHRDMTTDERRRIDRHSKNLEALGADLDAGEVDVAHLSEKARENLRKLVDAKR